MFRGFLGRLLVAVEPFVVATFFTMLPLGLLARRQEFALLVTPIFAGAALGFFAYAVALMVPSTRALLETFGRIRVVDGYVHYTRHVHGDVETYRVAVLDAHHRTLGEWPLRAWPASIGDRDLWAAMIEFSEFGGIHRIDGRSTGVLPDVLPPLGIGAPQDAEARGETEPRKFPRAD